MYRIAVALAAAFSVSLAQPAPVGHWTFDNSSNLTAATVGSALALTGTHTAVAGPNAGDGAVSIGAGSYYRVTHGIAANGGGAMVNEYTLVIDFRVAATGQWHCFFQTDPNNSGDGDCFINTSGQIGVGGTGYTTATVGAGTWYRMAVVVDNGSRYEVYLNRTQVLNGTVQPLDGRFALASTLLLFADDNGEDNTIEVAQVRLYSSALSASDVSALGIIVPDGAPHFLNGPTLQSVTQSGATIVWETAANETGRVDYGTTASYGSSQAATVTASGGGTWLFSATLASLQPGTTYHYQAVSGTSVAGDSLFMTRQASETNAWAAYRHDANRSAATDETVALPLYTQWVYKARHKPSPAWTPPAKLDVCHGISYIPDQMTFDRSYYTVASRGRAFFGCSSDDKVYCLDAATGHELWTFFTEGPVRFAPALTGDRALFGSDDGYVYCVNAADGSLAWKYTPVTSDRRLAGNGRVISVLPVRTDVLVDGSGNASCAAGIWEAMSTLPGMQSRQLTLSAANGAVVSNVASGQMLQGHLVLQSGGSILWPTGLRGRPFDYNPTLHYENDGAVITVGARTFTGGAGTVSTSGWSAAVRGRAHSLSFAGGRLFVGTDSGYIYCFGPSPASVDTVTPASAPMRYSSGSLQTQYANAAQQILATTGITRGYCLVLESRGGHLAYELAARSGLTIVCVEADSAAAALSRRNLDSAGVYGRVAVHRITASTLPFVDAMFNIVTFDGYGTGQSYAGSRTEVLRLLRPYGGMAFLGPGSGDIICRNAVQRAGEWSHFYSNPQNNPNSGDQYVGADVTLQWYGNPGPDHQVERDFKAVAPLWKDGITVVPGYHYVTAVDAYNGALLWEKAFPKLSRMPGHRDASPVALQADYAYVAVDDTCFGLTLREGTVQLRFPVPSFGGVKYAWGYLATVGDAVFGSAADTTIAREVTPSFENSEIWVAAPPWPVSEYLFARNRFSGAEMWRYTPAGLVINSSIAIDNGRVIFLESSNSSLRSQVRNRFPLADLLGNGSSSLVALNAATGAEVWRQPTNLSNITTLVYLSCPEGRILLTAVYGGSSNVTYDLYGFSQSNGSQSWKTTIATGSTDLMHGVERGHPVVVNGVAYFVCGPSVYFAVNISTGAQVSWTFNRSGWGCGTACASATHLYVRGDNAVAWNLATSQASRFTTRSRPGCYIDVIPAGGLVNIPETSSGCTCDAYKIQTSMAFRTNLPFEAPTAAQSGRGARKATAPPRVFVLRSPNALIVSAAGIAEGRRVKLSIVNLMGREVFRANGLSQGDAHSHTFVWDNRAAAGGTYVVRLEAGEQHAEQSVTLVR